MNWHASRKLGSGSYGAVYKGELEDGSEVAIKAIDLAALGAAGQSAEMAGFDEEVQMLSKFRHPNLVTLLGWGKHNLNRYLVYELLAGGDAFQRLQKSKNPRANLPFHFYERLSVLLDAATGLSHMHNSKPKAFHRDIKSANILIDRHGTAKMADFGLSCTSGHGGALHVTVRTISGTPGYACPLYSRTGRVTEGSEVYSFGMVMLELLTGLAPAAADPHRPGNILYHIGDQIKPSQPGAMDRIIRGLDASAAWPIPLGQELGAMGLRCVHATDETQRPRFVEIVRAIRKLGERFPKPAAVPQSLPSQVPQVPQHLTGVGGPAAPGHGIQQSAVAASHSDPRVRADSAYERRDARPISAPQQQQAAPGAAPKAPEVFASSSAPAANAMKQPLNSGEAPWSLDLVKAAGVDINTLPTDMRSLSLTPVIDSTGGSQAVAVGRQHQTELFEKWMPDDSLRSCISRTAFEVAWSSASETGIHLIARGGNPVSVDGKMAPRDAPVPLRSGSDISFTYMVSGELSVFLQLRFVSRSSPVQRHPAAVGKASPTPSASSTPVPSKGTSVAGSGSAVAGPAVYASPAPKSQTAPSPAPQQAARGMPPMPQSPAFEPPSRATPGKASGDDRVKTSPGWRLECIRSEGMSAAGLASLTSERRSIDVGESTLMLGRQHQPQFFEEMLAEASSRLSLISRTHVQLELHKGKGLVVTNMSSNPLYIDSDMIGKEDPRTLMPDQILSFARLEDGAHIYFLQLQVKAPADFVAAPREASRATPATTGSRSTGPSDKATVEARTSAQERENAAKVRWSPTVEDGRGRPPPDDGALQPAPDYDGGGGGGGVLARNSSFASTAAVSERAPSAPSSEAASPEKLSPQKQRGTGDKSWLPNLPECLPPSPSRPPAWSPGPSPRPPGASSTASSPSKPRTKDALPPRPAASPMRPPPMNAEEETPEVPATRSEVVLELSGSNVLDVPMKFRSIGPISLVDRPLYVGRKHQPELHKSAVTKECLQFLSRDHFRIAVEDGVFRMLVMTSNPVWRDRPGVGASAELARGDIETLEPGDRIVLGTGEDTSTMEEARASLCWLFRRATAQDMQKSDPEWSAYGGEPRSAPSVSPEPKDHRSGHRTPPSPGGVGPRVPSGISWGGGRRDASPAGRAFEPMLPPASELLGVGGRDGDRGGRPAQGSHT
eukprot:CAMPEP_0115319372 /NCGR_PEP_ID=MMETSP0270-20121206/79729_1 /TAXON_ID=71861 /ORGANISM="Scrippsiella trochoidea, Strain CCMP3099" /LENGTH=1178 /DNA_ID=CAMNT_0002739057 /DNA_START=70 /DNA_END=3602 /DNA_ORIENTATION=+